MCFIRIFFLELSKIQAELLYYAKIPMSNYKLSYSKHGNRQEVLFLFHGVGQDRFVFDTWLPALTKCYTVYTLDLFYHGESMRKYGPLSQQEWRENFSEILKENEIEGFSVLGFSLGGRFAIATAFEFEDQINQLCLIAPDAVYRTPWFRMATSPGIKWVFKYYMLHPNKLGLLIQSALKLKLVSKYMADFVQRALGVPENRKRVYISWNHFKPLGYSHRQLRKHFKNAKFYKTLILGSKDIVIPPKRILPILKDCGFDVKILDKKHHQLVKVDVLNSVLQ